MSYSVKVTVEDLTRVAGKAPKVRQVRYPVLDTNGMTTAIILYRGKQEARKAAQHLGKQQLAGQYQPHAAYIKPMQAWKNGGYIVYFSVVGCYSWLPCSIIHG